MFTSLRARFSSALARVDAAAVPRRVRRVVRSAWERRRHFRAVLEFVVYAFTVALLCGAALGTVAAGLAFDPWSVARLVALLQGASLGFGGLVVGRQYAQLVMLRRLGAALDEIVRSGFGDCALVAAELAGGFGAAVVADEAAPPAAGGGDDGVRVLDTTPASDDEVRVVAGAAAEDRAAKRAARARKNAERRADRAAKAARRIDAAPVDGEAAPAGA